MPWVAENPSDAPPKYVPTDDDIRGAIIDTLLGQKAPGDPDFDDLKDACIMITGYEGPNSEF